MKRQFGILAGEEQDMINEKHELTAAQIDAITSTPAQPHNLDARAWCRAAIAADRALNADAGVMRQTVTEEMVTAYLTANWGAHWAWIDFPKDLHPNTADLVIQFAKALAQKLRASELKYGYADGWEDKGWMDECRAKLLQHIAKGDPLDVAAYCAFLWHHGESTTPPAEQQREQEPVAWIDEVGNVFPLTAYRPDGKRASWTDAHKRGWEPIYTHPAPGLAELRAKVEAIPTTDHNGDRVDLWSFRRDVLEEIDKLGGRA